MAYKSFMCQPWQKEQVSAATSLFLIARRFTVQKEYKELKQKAPRFLMRDSRYYPTPGGEQGR